MGIFRLPGIISDNWTEIVPSGPMDGLITATQLTGSSGKISTLDLVKYPEFPSVGNPLKDILLMVEPANPAGGSTRLPSAPAPGTSWLHSTPSHWETKWLSSSKSG